MQSLKIFGAAIIMSAIVSATPNNPDTDWLSQAKYGVAMGFVPTAGNFPDAVNSFNVDSLANQLAESGAAYFTISLGQNSGYMISPNRTYDSLTGYAPGSHCSTRDLPMELANALIPRGIKLMLYLPAQPPNEDTHAQSSFGLVPQSGSDRPVTATGATRWAMVIQEWADRYGDKVSGWWFDGCYGHVINDDQSIFQKYAAALKHGNPNAICAFNPGAEAGNPEHYTDYEDFTAGEIGEGISSTPSSRWLGGSQWHALPHMGTEWGGTDMQLTTNQWITYLEACSANQGVVSLDVGKNANGTICANHYEQLIAIKNAIRPATSIQATCAKSFRPKYFNRTGDTQKAYSINGSDISRLLWRGEIKSGMCIIRKDGDQSEVRRAINGVSTQAPGNSAGFSR